MRPGLRSLADINPGFVVSLAASIVISSSQIVFVPQCVGAVL